MKRSKRFLSLLLAVLVVMTTVMSVSIISTSAAGTLASYYKTNPNGQVGANKTISIDGSLSDWDSSMLIAQGTANDDPRVYRPNSMYELGVDLYALYGAYDDNNIYIMWEMTNVQDVVAPNDNYPLSQGVLWQTQEFPFFIMVDTGKADTAIGNNGALQGGAGHIWGSGMTVQNSFNKLIAINTKGFNGPWVYGGDSTGLNPKELLTASTSKVKMGYGLGILSDNVYGIDKAYGEYNGRVPGDVCDESAAWVDFNTLGHSSSTMDFFYEMSIPYSELGITKSDVEANGVGVMVVATMGMSPMDCLPGDPVMTDQADLDDAANSQENNSFEKSDEDFITAPFARIGKLGSGTVTPPVENPTEASTTEAPVITEPTEAPTEAPTDPVYTEPVYTEPVYTDPIYTDPTDPPYDDNSTITIYVNCNNGWGNVYWHGWNDAGATNTAWPGDPMESIGNGIYKAQIDASFTGIVFNDSNGNQTGDVTIAGDGQMYDLSTGSWSAYTDNGGGGDIIVSGDYIYFTDNQNWGTVYCHTWNMDGGTTVWPGTQMEYVDGKYRAMVDGSHTKVKFNGGLGGPESGEFDLVLGNSYSN